MMRGVNALVRRLRADHRGVGAIEFAMTAPFLILLYLGSYQLLDAISAYRKVTTTTRTLADLTSQFTSVTADDVDNIADAATSVMVPYSAANTLTRISEIKINAAGIPKVAWSRPSSGARLRNSDLVTPLGLPNSVVPTALRVPGTYIVYSEVTYSYNPNVGTGLIGPIPMTDRIFMNPRRSNDIPCGDC